MLSVGRSKPTFLPDTCVSEHIPSNVVVPWMKEDASEGNFPLKLTVRSCKTSKYNLKGFTTSE